MNLVATALVPLITLMGVGESKNAFDKVEDAVGRSTYKGIWEPKVRFDYALMLGTLRTSTYVQLIECLAQIAAKRLLETGQITIIIHDNASVHKSHLARQQHRRWQQQGMYIFYLPLYSPQMNRIEDKWLHIKRDELAGQVFEDEYELASAIMDGINHRAKQGQY
ncbi:MAG: transposase [Nostoc sp.]|uniref:transposase n=1 Tax=Nostoc sp. TaxID=1180 RepID=UPI002FFB326B